MHKPPRNTADTVLFALIAACGLLCICAVLVWAGPCSGVLELANGNAVPMRCAYASKMIVAFAVVLVVASVKGIVTGNYDRTVCVLLALGMISATFESIVGVGVCKSEMACWTMAFWARTCAGVAIVAACASGVLKLKAKQVR